MFTALSFVFGGLFRLFPEVMKLWDKQKERQHELDMLDRQLKVDEARAKLEMQKVEVEGAISMNKTELEAIVAATKAQAQPFQKTGNRVLDFMLVTAEVASSLVRPVLTYWYCVVAFGAYKAGSYMLLLNSGAEWDQAIVHLWTENDQAVMFSIIGFWFVDRAIRHQGTMVAK